ncbi:hypothetical protein [Arcticibacter tournemirensis]
MDDYRNTGELDELIERVIKAEKEVPFDPALSLSVMGGISVRKVPVYYLYQKVIQNMAIAACVLIAVFLGIYLGNLYSSYTVHAQQESVSANDAQLEKLNMFVAQ